MIVATIINIVSGKKGKALGPLEVMGYEDEGQAPKKPVDPLLAQQGMALRLRLMQASQGLALGKGHRGK